MPILDTEIIAYGSVNMRENDTDTPQGGGIDLTTRVVFDSAALANAPAGVVKVVSSASGDTTQTVTVYGRNAGGSIVNEALSLNGTNVVTGTTSFERILKIVVSASHTGTITVKDNADATIVTIESGVLTIRRPFYDVSADAAGGSSRDFYEKIFIRNTNATLSLLNATVKENADPGGNITFALDNAVSGTTTSTNRRTAPASGVGTFDGTDKAVPGTDLAAETSIGVWLKLTLAAGTAPAKTTYTLQVTGSTI